MVERPGAERAEVPLQVLVDAGCTLIKEAHLKAAEYLLLDDEFAGSMKPAGLTAAIVALGENGKKEGRISAAMHSVPQWRGLASVWFQKRTKSRSGPRLVQFDAVEATFVPAAPPRDLSRRPAPAGRIIDRRPLGPVPLGELEPGRSALNRQQATG